MKLLIKLYRFLLYSAEVWRDSDACDSGLHPLRCYLCFGFANIFEPMYQEQVCGMSCKQYRSVKRAE